MFGIASRGGKLAPYYSAVVASVPGRVLCKPRSEPQQLSSDFANSMHATECVWAPEPRIMTAHTMALRAPKRSLLASVGTGVTSQIRYAHTDVKIPDFGDYRVYRDPSQKVREHFGDVRVPQYVALGVMGSVTLAGAKYAVSSFIDSMNASADVISASRVEVKLGEIPEGSNVTIKWRNKPLFVRHRTDEEIERERAVDMASLRDAQADDSRTKNPKWLIVVGVCTHLGCVPIAGMGDFGGYYCPCHGSHYDASGRIRKGPAPANLEVPEYQFLDDETVIVG